ncbi:hypothetical protein PVK06_044398 [Gossypium arboreum]|uniref:Uncharacterized protein n=1 Tax=Gossypium arboreum TaxID=29729 RepID=A0ABR0MR41_GOSAR|nr:hypothetical protein PVK06_044398 [Gossypium arboreum]
MLKEDSWNSRDKLWKTVWKIPGPQRVRFFFWIVLKQKLLTNVERVRRGLANDASYSICGHASENILHIIRDCTVAKEVWKQNYGALDGLKLIQRRGHDNVIIHSDSLEVVKAIHENDSKKPTSALLRRIHQILSQERQWIIRHIPREENQSADYLAKMALGRGGIFT